MADSSGSWREDTLRRLRQRNCDEVKPFCDLIQRYNKMFEKITSQQMENTSLTFMNEKLRQENLQLKPTSEIPSSTSLQTNENIQELQKKLFNVQEELTELHRRKGENAQQVIDLTSAVKLNERELGERQTKIESLQAEIVVLQHDLKKAEANIAELESTNQLLKDEYQALQLALNSAENKLTAVKKENDDLVVKVMLFKAQDAERMNAENDVFMKKQQQIMQIELAEAAKEQKNLTPEQMVGQSIGLDSLLCTGVSVPTRAYLKFDAHDNEIMTVRWDLNGRLLATAGADRKIKLWEVAKGSADCRATLTGSNAAVMSVDFDVSGTMVLGASNDFATRVWTVDDSRLRHTLTGHSGKVMSAKFFGDSSRVVSGSHDRTLKVWDLRSKACISTKFAGSSCNDIVTSEEAIISGHFDKKVRFWDNRAQSTQPANEVVLGGKVTSLDLSKDGYYLVICSRDDHLKVLDLRMTSVVGTYGSEGFHVGCDWTQVCFSPDNEHIVAGSGDGAVYVWGVNSGLVEKVLREHTTAVSSASWHPGGSNLVTADKNKKVVIWADM